MQQVHTRFLKGASTFTVIAGRAGSYDVFPGVPAIEMTRHNVIDRQDGSHLAAVLASVIIAPEDLTPVERYLRMRSVDHVLQTNDRRDGISRTGSMHDAAAIHYKIGFIGEH